MPLKIYLPGQNREPKWEDSMCPPAPNDHMSKHGGELPPRTIDEQVKRIFPRAPWEGDDSIKQVLESGYAPQKVEHHPEHVKYSAIDKANKQANDELFGEVKSPTHYAYGGIEAIDYIKAKLSPEEFSGYCWGNVLKYISRFNKKDGVKDLRKAKVYLDWLVDAYEKRLVFPHKVVE